MITNRASNLNIWKNNTCWLDPDVRTITADFRRALWRALLVWAAASCGRPILCCDARWRGRYKCDANAGRCSFHSCGLLDRQSTPRYLCAEVKEDSKTMTYGNISGNVYKLDSEENMLCGYCLPFMRRLYSIFFIVAVVSTSVLQEGRIAFTPCSIRYIVFSRIS